VSHSTWLHHFYACGYLEGPPPGGRL
jgi:hypothetical protein